MKTSRKFLVAASAVLIAFVIFGQLGCGSKKPSGSMPTAIRFTKWDWVDSAKTRKGIVFLSKDSIRAQFLALNPNFTDDSSYVLSPHTAIPTISVFRYGSDHNAIMHIRIYRTSEPPPPPPIGSPIGAPLEPTMPDAAGRPSLSTFTSANNPNIHDVGNGQSVTTAPNQINFATRISPPLHDWYNYAVEGWWSPNGTAFNAMPPALSAYQGMGSFIDPATGFTKYYNYWRVLDGAAGTAPHETRITICLEEPQ